MRWAAIVSCIALVAWAAIGAPTVFAAISVDRAVIPEWPGAKRKGTHGEVEVEFAIAPSGRAHPVGVLRNELGDRKFAVAATEALADWRFKVDPMSDCVLRRGRQTFVFDAAAVEPVDIGETKLQRPAVQDTPRAVGWIAFLTYYKPIRMDVKSTPYGGSISGTGSSPFRMDMLQRELATDAPMSWAVEPQVKLLPSSSHTLQTGLYAIAFHVAADGKVLHPRIIESAPDDYFEALALKSLDAARVTTVEGTQYHDEVCQIIEFWRN